MKRDESFPRSERICTNSDFQNILATGHRYSSGEFVLYVRIGGTGRRIGIRVGKRVGSAVQRNRIKRLVRETFRRHRNRLKNGLSMVVIARSGAPRLSYDDCVERLISLWHKSRILDS